MRARACLPLALKPQFSIAKQSSPRCGKPDVLNMVAASLHPVDVQVIVLDVLVGAHINDVLVRHA